MIIPTAEPFFFAGGKIGCLLVHGFTGAPREMRPMGEYLAEKGYSVLGVRLAGHATQPQDLQHTRWGDWLNSVEDGYHLLKGVAERIFVCGLSMGGILTLEFAAHFPITGLVAMSTPYELPPDPRMKFINILKWLIPRVEKGESDWKNPEAGVGHIDYPYNPTYAIAELIKLLAAMRQSLPHITVPALIIHSRQDQGVTPENAEKIYQHLGTKDKELLWVENSGHVITCDFEKERVFQATDDFIHRVCGQTI